MAFQKMLLCGFRGIRNRTHGLRELLEIPAAHPLGQRRRFLGHLYREAQSFDFLREYLAPIFLPGQLQLDLPAEPGEDGVIEHVAPVGGSDHPDLRVPADAIPLGQKCVDDVGGKRICFGCATAAKNPFALVNEDDRRLIFSCPIPNLANTLAACPHGLLLQVGQ